MSPKTFIKITNEDIFHEIKSLQTTVEELKKIKQEVSFLRKFTYSLSGAVFTGFLFIISYMLK